MQRCNGDTPDGQCSLGDGHGGACEVSDLHRWLATARREGMIEGLERALEFVPRFTSTHQAIRAEVERLKGGA